MHSILKALQKLGDVDCIFIGGPKHSHDIPEDVVTSVIHILPTPDFTSIPVIGRLLKMLPHASREWWLSYIPGYPKLYRHIENTLQVLPDINADEYDVVFFIRIPSLWWPRWNYTIPSIVDIDDVMHLGLQENAASCNGVVKKIIAYWHYYVVKNAELRSLRQASTGFVCSEHDRNSICLDNIRVLPNIVPDRGQFDREIPIPGFKTILFVGALVYKPNREGLEYFIEQIFPLIRKYDPEVTLRIVGRSLPEHQAKWSNLPNIEFLGTVDDIDPIIESSGISICPLLFGLGTRIKILEALSFGKPVVSTTIGAHGIGIFEDSGLFRADTPELFASTCIKLLCDKKLLEEIYPKARSSVIGNFSQNYVDAVIKKAVDKAIN